MKTVTELAQQIADQELEACKQAIVDQAWFVVPKHRLVELHNVRRPKPPTLKEQALAALNVIEDKMLGPTTEEKLIRQALEALDD